MFNMPKKKQNKIEPSTQNRTMLLNKSKTKKASQNGIFFTMEKERTNKATDARIDTPYII